MERTMATVVRQRNLPDPIRKHSGLVRWDYVDLFTVAAAAAQRRSPEQWARAAVEVGAGDGGQLVWRGLLGLRLAPRASPDHIAGWRIAGRGDAWIRLEAASWFLTAHLVVWVGAGEVSIATFVRYDRPPASVVWPPLAYGHRQAMPGVLVRATRHLARRRAR
jgi:hypothetical protein